MMASEKEQVAARVEQTVQDDSEEEDECDYKEPREEELSLIAHSDSGDNPVPIIRTPHTRHKHYSSGIHYFMKHNKVYYDT